MTAVVPRQPTAEDIDQIRDLVRAGAVGPWHYRWTELTVIAARIGLRPDDAVWRAHDGTWSKPAKPDEHLTPADAIREATVR